MHRLKWLAPSIGALLIAGLAWGATGPKPGVNSPWNPVWSIPIDSTKNTYRATASPLSPVVSSAGDIVQICGNSTSVVRVTRVIVSGRADAVQAVDWYVAKRSTASAGGVLSSTAAAVPLDAAVGAADSSVTYGVTSGANGTLIGYIAVVQQFLGNLTTGPGGPTETISFGDGPVSAAILRSATQCLGIGISQTSVAGNSLNVAVEWTEE